MNSVSLPSGYHHLHRDCAGSTNDEARSLAEQGAPDGTIVSAKVQTAGRGRNGRVWISQAGNLFFSLVLRTDRPAVLIPQLSFVASLATADAISELVRHDAKVSCKWPNDVLVGGRKISGLLLEAAPLSGTKVDWLIVGAGINIVSHPEDVLFPATSIREWSASPVPPEQVLASFCRHHSQWRRIWETDGFSVIRQAWLKNAEGLGRPVRIKLADETVGGTFDGLTDDGAMVLLQENGETRTITSGDVFFPPTKIAISGDADAFGH